MSSKIKESEIYAIYFHFLLMALGIMVFTQIMMFYKCILVLTQLIMPYFFLVVSFWLILLITKYKLEGGKQNDKNKK